MAAALASALHLYFFALMTAAFFMRAYHLGRPLDEERIGKVLFWDNACGAAVVVVMGAGLWRLFGGLEKDLSYYLANDLFWAKMAVLTVGWGLETPLMVTFIRWRIARGKGEAPNTSGVPLLRKFERAEGVGLMVVVVCASLMARGFGQAQPEGAEALVAGRTVYEARCVTCHQADGGGLGGRLAADLSRSARKPEANLLDAVTNGVPGTAMVAWKDVLSEDERRDVVAYVRARFGSEP